MSRTPRPLDLPSRDGRSRWPFSELGWRWTLGQLGEHPVIDNTARDVDSGTAMWNVEDRFEPAVLEALPAKGFRVSSTGGVVRVEKYGCGAELRRMPDGRFQMTILPSILLQGQFTLLWDAGYQKFLITEERHKVPAVAEQLLNMRRFNEELRTALGVPTYYNEALGSTCQVSTYDRLQGRPGAVPDESVGVKPEPEED